MWLKALIISFAVTAAFEPLLIPFLRKLKFGQTILDDGPVWHKNKQGTPTMGGIGFIMATIIGSMFFIKSTADAAALLCGTLFGAIGFVDDYIKVVKKQNQGFTAKQKFAAQTVLSLVYAVYMYLFADNGGVLVPFAGIRVNIGILYIPFVMLVLLATTNSANLTDGLDGLAAGVGATVALFFCTICIKTGATATGIISAALCGGLLGFLIYNAYPAKVFMGDTGSLFIGGIIAAVSVNAGLELFIIIGAFVFLFEALSVIIQVTVYKKTKKRVFKMAPVHHHFEKCGWKETKVVAVFCAITAVLCLIGYAAI